MVNFCDQTSPYPLLEIANDERYSSASVLTLKVHPPVIGAFPLDKRSPNMSLHLDKWSTKKEIDVLHFNKVINTTAFVLHSPTHDKEFAATYPNGSNKGLATWNYPQSGFGEFRYVTCYWEWVEDVLSRSKEALERTKIYDAVFASLFTYDVNDNVLQAFCELWHSSTNTICVGIGELSISLWDMHMIGGLPVHGTFFNEVVPSAKELSQTDQQAKPFLPKTCAYLFSAFYRLSNGAYKEVSVRDWVNFWFKGPERYTESPPRGPKQHAKPKSNHSPNGYIDVIFTANRRRERPFRRVRCGRVS